MLQLLAGSLQSGFSLPQALDAVVREDTQPASPASSPAPWPRPASAPSWRTRSTGSRTGWTRRTCAGRSWRSASSATVGGNLVEVLRTTVETMRERALSARHVRALSAEGRLSAYILIALPILIGASCSSPATQLHAPAVHHPARPGHADRRRGARRGRRDLDAQRRQGGGLRCLLPWCSRAAGRARAWRSSCWSSPSCPARSGEGGVAARARRDRAAVRDQRGTSGAAVRRPLRRAARLAARAGPAAVARPGSPPAAAPARPRRQPGPLDPRPDPRGQGARARGAGRARRPIGSAVPAC